MFSWLNFEELLIHNPIELINPSKDTISVAMSKKQYIEFFSNKYTYNGLYYDEAMDFCLFYYADPLQSVKDGDVYAQGYIDVEMKIYRVKWLCNVSISSPSGLLQTTDGTQGVPQEGGKYTHTAWAYSADGADRFSTVYPKPNLLNGTKVHDIFKGTGTANRGGTQRYTLDKGLKISDLKLSRYQDLIFEFDWKATGTNPSGTFVYQTQTYYKGTSVTVSPTNTSGHVKNTFYNLPVTTDISTFIKIRQDNIPTTVTVEISNLMMYIVDYSPWMPSASEVTTADWPSYIGQYTDYTLEDSTNPSSYTWREIQEDKWNVTKTGMLVSPQAKHITMVQAGALMRCEINNNITGWTDGTTQLNYSGQDFVIDGYGMRGLHNG
jgi:hypothetical protein